PHAVTAVTVLLRTIRDSTYTEQLGDHAIGVIKGVFLPERLSHPEINGVKLGYVEWGAVVGLASPSGSRLGRIP
ncbi:hypothetical protein RRG08_066314, partial [Elysia crispata]